MLRRLRDRLPVRGGSNLAREEFTERIGASGEVERFVEAIDALKQGAIGTPYLARAWYANTRKSIGKGKPAPVPQNLDYELWQGPAPRRPA